MVAKTRSGLFVALLLICSSAAAQGSTNPAPPEPYVNVSELLPLPEFIPAVGALYIDPANVPIGPYLAYGSDGELIELLYMVPLSQLNQFQAWDDLPAGVLAELGVAVDHVDLSFVGGHPGMEEQHYHFRLVLVDPEQQRAALTE